MENQNLLKAGTYEYDKENMIQIGFVSEVEKEQND